MDTQEIARTIRAKEPFVRRQIRLAKKDKFLSTERQPTDGRRVYVDSALFAAWLEKQGYHSAAKALANS